MRMKNKDDYSRAAKHRVRGCAGVKAERSELGQGTAPSSPVPPQGWTGVWEISAGVVVPARNCGSNPQNASLHSTHKTITHQSYSYPVGSIHIILSVCGRLLLLLILSHRTKYFCFQGVFNL